MHLIIKQCELLRRALGLSQMEYARRARTAQGAISQILRGVTDPRLSTAQKLVRALGADCTISLISPVGELPLTPGYGWPPLTGSHRCSVQDLRVRFDDPSGNETLRAYLAGRQEHIEVRVTPCRTLPVESPYDRDLQQLVQLLVIHQTAVAYATSQMQRRGI